VKRCSPTFWEGIKQAESFLVGEESRRHLVTPEGATPEVWAALGYCPTQEPSAHERRLVEVALDVLQSRGRYGALYVEALAESSEQDLRDAIDWADRRR